MTSRSHRKENRVSAWGLTFASLGQNSAHLNRALILGALTALSTAAYAASQSEELEFRTLPPEPKRPSEKADETPEPEVRIIRRKDATIEEYRVNGQVRAIKVIPAQGPEYYLIDTDGDGQLDTRSSELSDDILVPGWVIFSW